MKTNIWIALGIIAAMVLAYLIHNMFPISSPMDKYLEEVEEAILAEEWGEVRTILRKIDREWKRSRLLISINNRRLDIQEFTRTLAVLQAYTKVEDRASAYAEAAHLKERWWGFAE